MIPMWVCALFLWPQQDPGQEELKKKMEEMEREIQKLKLRLEAQEEAAPPEKRESSSLLNAFNPQITLFGNVLFRLDNREVLNDDGDAIDDTVNFREAELDFRAAIDPYADGLLILAAEAEVPGEYEVGVEEGIVTLKKIPLGFLEESPLGMQWRLGRFRTEIGRSNRLHLHDLPQSDRPLVLTEFFGEEGMIGDGVSLGLLPPAPEGWPLELALQTVHHDGEFVHLGNLRVFRTIAEDHSVDLSVIGLYREELAEKTYSVDALYRWKPAKGGEWKSLVVGGQAFYQSNEAATPFGYYVFGQFQLDQPWYAGVRWDWTERIDDDTLDLRRITPYVSFYLSEFLRLRVSYEQTWSDTEEEDGLKTLLVEVNAVFGSHPAEPFWVNR